MGKISLNVQDACSAIEADQPQQEGLLTAVTNLLAFGIVVCDVNSRILYVNETAKAFAADQKGLFFRPRTRSVAALDTADTERLDHFVHRACLDRTASSIILRDRAREPSLMIVITPLPAGEVCTTKAGYALLAVKDLRGVATFDEGRLSDLFRLSPTQASIALALYNGSSFEDIAAARRVKVSTLRTHFGEILVRTGAKSLRDLTRRLGLIPPVLQKSASLIRDRLLQ